MLILTRRIGERIIIGTGQIKITLIRVDSKNQARIGIEIDESIGVIPVNREEIFKQYEGREHELFAEAEKKCNS